MALRILVAKYPVNKTKLSNKILDTKKILDTFSIENAVYSSHPLHDS